MQRSVKNKSAHVVPPRQACLWQKRPLILVLKSMGAVALPSHPQRGMEVSADFLCHHQGPGADKLTAGTHTSGQTQTWSTWSLGTMPLSSDRVVVLRPARARGGTPGLRSMLHVALALRPELGWLPRPWPQARPAAWVGLASFPTVTWCRPTLLPLRGLSGSKMLLFSLKTDKMHERQRRKDYVKRSELFFQ